MEKAEREAKLQKLVARLCDTLLEELCELGELETRASLLATVMTGATIFSAHCMAMCAMSPGKTLDEQCTHIDKSAAVLARIAAEHAKKLCAANEQDEQSAPLMSLLKH